MKKAHTNEKQHNTTENSFLFHSFSLPFFLSPTLSPRRLHSFWKSDVHFAYCGRSGWEFWRKRIALWRSTSAFHIFIHISGCWLWRLPVLCKWKYILFICCEPYFALATCATCVYQCIDSRLSLEPMPPPPKPNIGFFTIFFFAASLLLSSFHLVPPHTTSSSFIQMMVILFSCLSLSISVSCSPHSFGSQWFCAHYNVHEWHAILCKVRYVRRGRRTSYVCRLFHAAFSTNDVVGQRYDIDPSCKNSSNSVFVIIFCSNSILHIFFIRNLLPFIHSFIHYAHGETRDEERRK